MCIYIYIYIIFTLFLLILFSINFLFSPILSWKSDYILSLSIFLFFLTTLFWVNTFWYSVFEFLITSSLFHSLISLVWFLFELIFSYFESGNLNFYQNTMHLNVPINYLSYTKWNFVMSFDCHDNSFMRMRNLKILFKN